MNKDALRIGVVCYPTFGGSGVIAAELALGMAKRGHRVHLLSTAPPNRLLADGMPVFFHQVPVADYPLFDHPPYAMAMAAKIVEVVTDHRLDILHVHYSVPHATSAFLAKQVLNGSGPRVVTTLHGTDVTRVGMDMSLQSINRFSVMASDGVTVPSDYLKRAAMEDLGIAESCPIEVIPNFVDSDHFVPAEVRDRRRLAPLFTNGVKDEDSPVLVHVSNFRPVKRVVDTIEVLAKVNQHTPARLVLVGDGPERGRASQRARELGVSGRVSFLGTRADFVEYLKHADMFLLPSETESFGLAALEALASGVPVVAYRVGGLPEVIADQKVGLLTPPQDTDAMASAVVDLIRDPARHARMAQAARTHVLEQFAYAPAIQRYEQYYHQVLEKDAALA